MKKLVFVILLVALLLSLTLSVALAGVGWEDPQPPGAGKNNADGNDPHLFVPRKASCNAGFVGGCQ